MSSLNVDLAARYRAAVRVLGDLPTDIGVLHTVDELELLELNKLQAEAGRLLGAAGAAIAGELAHRSRPELGSEGLARRTGHRTVESLLKSTTGATKEQASTAVRAGTLLVEVADDGKVDNSTGEVHEAAQPWLRPVAEAVAAGRISTSALSSISAGLGRPNSSITAAQLESAATTLVAQAVGGVDADRLWRAARELRDELDLAGVKLAEEEGRALRGLTHHPLSAGGGVATWRMDVETYANFVDFYDRTTSPKRGGVRFVDPAKVEKARKIEDDSRNYKQLASDTLLHFLRLGADADPKAMLGSGAPIIRVTVAADALTTGVGLGRIDGQAQPISIDTVKRLMESGKVIRAGFDPRGTYIETFEDQLAENPVAQKLVAEYLPTESRVADNRLYNRNQREILAAKFGGCMDPDCDRPPGWCEAHHIQFVKRDGGKTTIRNAILLCKYHHLLYHNAGYEIRQADDGTYWKIPPKTIDPEQTPISMPLKTRNLADLAAAHRRAAERLSATECPEPIASHSNESQESAVSP